jgi:hypothetical protein
MKKPIRILSFFLIITLLGLFGTINVLGEILSISTEVEITGQENTSWNSSEGVYDGNGDATFTSTITSDDYNELAGMTVSSSVYNSQGIATNPDLVSISSIETVSESVYGAVYKATVTSDFDNLDFDDYTYNLGLLDGATNIGSDSKDFNVNSPYNVPETIDINDAVFSNGDIYLSWTENINSDFDEFKIEYTSGKMLGATYLSYFNIIRGAGYGITDEYLDSNVMRYSFVRLILRLLDYENDAIAYNGTPNFNDVGGLNVDNQNMLSYILANPELGFCEEGDTEFRPFDIVTSEELYKVLLASKGYIQDTDYLQEDIFAFASTLGITAYANANSLTVSDFCEVVVEALFSENNSLLNSLYNSGALDPNDVYGQTTEPYSNTIYVEKDIDSLVIDDVPSNYENSKQWKVLITALNGTEMVAKSNEKIVDGAVIKGKLTLHDDNTAPEDMEFSIGVVAESDKIKQNNIRLYPCSVKILQGENEIDYTIPIPKHKTYEKYDIYYSYQGNTDILDISKYGYYTNSSTNSDIDESTSLDVSNGGIINNIDIETIPANVLNVTLELPDGEVIPVGEDKGFSITAFNMDSSYTGVDSDHFQMSAGENAYTSKIMFPQDRDYILLSYSINSAFGGYKKSGYYTQTGTQTGVSSDDKILHTSGDSFTMTIIKNDDNVPEEITITDAQVSNGSLDISWTENITDSFDYYNIEYSCDNSPEYLLNLGLFYGENGQITDSFLAESPNRLQLARVFLRLKGLEDEAKTYAGVINFTDVSELDEEDQRILAYLRDNPELGFLGDTDGKFSPNKVVTAQEVYKILLTAMGYTINVDFEWQDTFTFADTIGMTELNGRDDITNYDFAIAIVEALKAENNKLLNEMVSAGIVDVNDVNTYKSTYKGNATALKTTTNSVIELPNEYSNRTIWEVRITANNSYNMVAKSKNEEIGYIEISGKLSLPSGIKAEYNMMFYVYLHSLMDEGDINADYTDYIEIDINKGNSEVIYTFAIPVNKRSEKNYIKYHLRNIQGEYEPTGYYSSAETVIDETNASAINTFIPLNIKNVDLEIIDSPNTKTISGTVSLPDGELAPEGGIYIEVSVNGLDSNGLIQFIGFVDKYVTIPAGQNSIDYSINFIENVYNKYIVFYTIHGESDYYEKGYYSYNRTISESEYLSEIELSNGSSINGINFEIIKKRTISGEIRFPNGVISENAFNINFTVASEEIIIDNEITRFYNCYDIDFPANQNKLQYSIDVPADFGKVYFSYGTNNLPGYIKGGRYSNGVFCTYEPNKTYLDISNGDTVNIDIELQKGVTITGKLKLLNGFVPIQETFGKIEYYSDSNTPNDISDDAWAWCALSYVAGSDTVEYSVVVPYGQNNGVISYNLWNHYSEYCMVGYYNSSGSVHLSEYAEKIDVTTQDISGYNFDILLAESIIGKAKLPDNDVAPVGGLDVGLSLYGVGQNGGRHFLNTKTEITIPEGESSFEFAINYSGFDYPQYTVMYQLLNSDAYVHEGYYNEDKTTPFSLLFDSFEIVDNMEPVELELIKGTKISGVVKLPGDDTATECFSTKIYLSKDFYIDGIYINYHIADYLTFNIDDTEKEYSLVVPKEIESTILECDIDSGSPPYLDHVQYTGPVSTYGWINRETLDLTNGDKENIDFELIRAIELSGRISTDAADIPDGEEWDGYIEYRTDNNTPDNPNDDFDSATWFTLTKSSNYYDYKIVVPTNLDNGYIQYKMNNCGDYLSKGYYKNTGTTDLFKLADRFDIKSENVTGKNLELVEGLPIKGELILPDNEALDEDIMWVSITVHNEDRSIYYNKSISLNRGDTSKSYSISLPSDTTGKFYLYAQPNSSIDYTESQKHELNIVNSQLINQDIYLTKPKVQGQIRKPDDSSGVRGYLNLADNNGKFIKHISAKSDGTFSIGAIPDGIYKIRAYPYYDDINKYIRSDEIEILIPNDGSLVTIHFKAPFLTGTVYNADGTEATDGWIEVVQYTNGYREYIESNSIRQGKYAIGNLPDGTYSIKARAYSNDNKNNCDSEEVEFTVTGGVASSSTIDLHFVGPQLTGNVLKPDGTNAKYGYIRVNDEIGEYVTDVSVSRSGAFNIAGLSDGNYEMIAYPDWNSKYSPSLPYSFSISGGQYAGNNPEIYLSQAQLEILIQDPDSNPEQDARVEVRGSDGRWVLSKGANTSGKAYIGGLSDGEYKITAYPSWSNADCVKSNEITVVIENGTFLGGTLSISLNRPQITGTVKKPDGTTTDRAYLQVYTVTGRWITSVDVKNNGSFAIGALQDGTYRIKAQPYSDEDLCPSDDIAVTIKDGAYGPSSLVIILKNPQITGYVYGPVGTADENNKMRYGYIYIYKQNGDFVAYSHVSREGKFKLTDIEDGNYKLKAWPDGNSQYVESDYINFKVQNGVSTGGTLAVNLMTASINGTVYDPSGQNPQKYGWIEIKEEDTGYWVDGTSIDGNGNFRIGKLDAGKYTLIAYPDWRSAVFQIERNRY